MSAPQSLWLAACLLVPGRALHAEDMPPAVAAVFQQYCADCHADGAAEGGFQFDTAAVDWSSHDALHAWEDAHQRISRQLMPPPDADQPSAAERRIVARWLDENLKTHSPVGGTTLRQLNRREYANTIRQLFGINEYEVPPGFPADSTASGFDNQAESLVMAGAHLEAYAEAASQIADQLFPPPRAPVKTSDRECRSRRTGHQLFVRLSDRWRHAAGVVRQQLSSPCHLAHAVRSAGSGHLSPHD